LRLRVAIERRARPNGPRLKDLVRSLEVVERQHRDHATFAARYGVRPYANTRSSVVCILRAGGAPQAEVRRVLDEIGPWGALSGPFDHGEVWGHTGRPTMLVGHPYNLGMHLEIFWDLVQIGLEVRTDGELYYGFGTYQALVLIRDAGHPWSRPTWRA
jgi:hypothetical protein